VLGSFQCIRTPDHQKKKTSSEWGQEEFQRSRSLAIIFLKYFTDTISLMLTVMGKCYYTLSLPPTNRFISPASNAGTFVVFYPFLYLATYATAQ
jgi:hypothetical protein